MLPDLLLTTATLLARSRVPLPDWIVVAWLILLGLSACCASREIDRPYGRVYAPGALWADGV
jgi:hypothetical protein